MVTYLQRTRLPKHLWPLGTWLASLNRFSQRGHRRATLAFPSLTGVLVLTTWLLATTEPIGAARTAANALPALPRAAQAEATVEFTSFLVVARTYAVRNQQAGWVRNSFMYNGQQVERGQPLIKLDVPTHPGAAAELITRGYVTAPASGRLTRSHVQVGSYLGRGATVAVIQDRSRLHALFRLPTSQAKQLVLGQRLPVTVLDASDQTSLAEVYQLTQATPTQAVLVLQLNNSAANPALRSGVRLRLRLAEQPALAGSQTVAGQ